MKGYRGKLLVKLCFSHLVIICMIIGFSTPSNGYYSSSSIGKAYYGGLYGGGLYENSLYGGLSGMGGLYGLGGMSGLGGMYGMSGLIGNLLPLMELSV